jgi:hypothetical protein
MKKFENWEVYAACRGRPNLAYKRSLSRIFNESFCISKDKEINNPVKMAEMHEEAFDRRIK